MDKVPYSSVGPISNRSKTHISGNDRFIDDENGIIFSNETKKTRKRPDNKSKDGAPYNTDLPWTNTKEEYIREYIFKKIIKDEKTNENEYDLLLIDGVL